MLSIAQEIQDQIAPYQSAINLSLDVATALPLIGNQLDSLQQLSTLLQNSLASIQSQTQHITTSGHYQIAIALPTISHTFTFDLGLDALLQVSTAGGVAATLTPVLNVGFDFDGNDVTLDSSNTNLDLGFSLSLPNFQATASLNGLLHTHIADASLSNQPGTSFTGNLKFEFDDNNEVNAEFSGDAHVRLDMAISFIDPALNASFNPTFRTQFQVDWGIDTGSNQLETPYIAFKNFSLDVDSFMDSFLGDIVKTAHKYTKPLQPFIDMFETPVPIVSAFDSSETMGDLLLKGASLNEAQRDRFELMVQVIKTVNTIDLSGSTGGAVLNFGDVELTGEQLDASGNLLGTFGFDTAQLSGVIDDIFNSPVLGEVKDALQSVARYTGVTSTAGFQFLVLEDPGSVIGGMLTGQVRDMFTFTTGRQHFEVAPSFGVGIEGVLGVFLSAGVIFDASFSMGYDTAGLIKLAQSPHLGPPALLHGFYFDNSVDTTAPPIPNVPAPKKTGLYLQGFAQLSGSAVITLSGGLYANINVELASPNHGSHVYLDDLITNLSSPAKIFNLSGQVYAAATAELTLPNPVGPDITLFSYELAKDVILDFNPPPQPSETKPLTVIDVTNQHTLMLDPAKIGYRGAVSVRAFHDYNVGSYMADGIRVDYANEIVLYVERKNNITSNYYNLIGINGTAPDGASILVVDPFRMFADEGAVNPAPAQTAHGVIFVGGRSVNYKYVEAADGSDATVLLVGGYGSSTLTGGTMSFGNFIPADRVNQAKQHFGNTTGFDAAGSVLINSAIDAGVAPASPAGIIGSTISASRGGLMFGGAGANSFIATGAGVYEMIGSTWVDTFNISPSFGGIVATYSIDAGGGDQDNLTVRVPAGENVTFENSPIVDKYDSSLKALAVHANAGLSATAHGLRKVKIVASKGSDVTLGDTSELDVDFSVTGGAHLVFGGTNASDDFSVVTDGPYHGLANHYSPARVFNYTPSGEPTQTSLIGWDGISFPLPNPVYYVVRTFGTNGRTQTVPFAVSDASASSVELNAGGASDDYEIMLSLGAFIDISIADTDLSTTNALRVLSGDGNLIYKSLNLTDTAVEFDYYTRSYLWSNFPPETHHVYMTSVHYTPAVSFSSNIVLTVSTVIPDHVTVDRPTAEQPLYLNLGHPFITTEIPYLGLGYGYNIWDLSTNPWTYELRNPNIIPHDMQILANAGPLSISTSTEYGSGITIIGNSGTISLHKSGGVTGTVDGIYVLGNTGVINVDYATTGNAFTGHVIVGGAQQNAANVHGTINLSGAYAFTIDDRARVGTSPNWLIAPTYTQVGDLTINYQFGYLYQAYWKIGSAVKYRDTIAFSFSTVNLNGLSSFPYFPLNWSPQSTINYNIDGESVSTQLSSYFFGSPPAGSTTYAAVNLPPGLSLDAATGHLSGTIPYNSYGGSPFATRLSATNGLYTREWTFEWHVQSAISVFIPYFEPTSPQPVKVDEAVYFSLEPISVTDYTGRTPEVTVTGLPPGLSYHPASGVISGMIPAGSSAQGPYEVRLFADNGLETNEILIPMVVSGIQLAAVPVVRLNHDGDTVNFNLSATTTSGGTLSYSATGLPPGITLDTTTGQVAGTLAANASSVASRYPTITFNDGYTTKTIQLVWTVLQTGINDTVTILPIGPQSSQVGEYPNVSAQAKTTFSLPIQYTIQGGPPGLPFSFSPDFYFNGYNYGGFSGVIPLVAARSTPYQVTITATNGLTSASVTFSWQISGPQPPELLGDYDGTGTVDQGDFDVWRNNFGQSVTPYMLGDGNGNGSVDAADYTIWRDNFSRTLPGAGAGAAAAAFAELELEAEESIASSPTESTSLARPVEADAIRRIDSRLFTARSTRSASDSRSSTLTSRSRYTTSTSDNLLQVLVSDRLGHSSIQDSFANHARDDDEHLSGLLDIQDFLDNPLALALAEWP